jgi:hypothetical protein
VTPTRIAPNLAACYPGEGAEGYGVPRISEFFGIAIYMFGSIDKSTGLRIFMRASPVTKPSST